MTYSGQMMLVLMLLIAWLIVEHVHAPPQREWLIGSLGLVIITIGLLLGFTRVAWLGGLAGATYLLWYHRRKWLLVLPILVVFVYGAAPDFLQQRVRSIGSNQEDHSAGARRIMYRAGWAMVKAHPIFGIGPEGPKYDFEKYRPDAFLPKAWY